MLNKKFAFSYQLGSSINIEYTGIYLFESFLIFLLFVHLYLKRILVKMSAEYSAEMDAEADAHANWTMEHPCKCPAAYCFTTTLTWETVPFIGVVSSVQWIRGL
jgi:hypothetical protein